MKKQPDGVRAPGSQSRAERLQHWLGRERHLVGASLLRIGLGSVVLYQLLGHWTDRAFLWGPRGVYPVWLFSRDLSLAGAPSFFAVESEPIFHAVYTVGVVVALLYLLGWQTRWVGIWLYVLVWSLVKLNPMLTSGGDTLVLVMLPFVLLMNTSAYLSADSRWRGIGDAIRPSSGPFAALCHNVGLGCVFVQLCIFYGFAGVYKLLGQSWRDGTAVYYALRLPEFRLPGLSELIYLNAGLVIFLTYATLAFELSFPLLVWSRRTRWIVAVQALWFHVFIAVFLGLALFSAQALIFQLVLFDDARYTALARRLGSWRSPPAEPPPSGQMALAGRTS
jgi:hypothetical protein